MHNRLLMHEIRPFKASNMPYKQSLGPGYPYFLIRNERPSKLGIFLDAIYPSAS